MARNSPVALAQSSLFTRAELELYERLLSDTKTTERDVSEFFSRFPKFLWMGNGSELRREVVLLATESAATRRVDFFRKRIGKTSWDIVELKSPQQPFSAGANTRHPRLSNAVNAAIHQALDYRDLIIADGKLRERLNSKGIWVYRPQIIVVVGQTSKGALSPEHLEVLYDRARTGPIEAMSYSDLLDFAKEHYSSTRQIVVPSLHYGLPNSNELIAELLEELQSKYGMKAGLLFLAEPNERRLRTIAGVGLQDSDRFASFSYSFDEASVATRVFRTGEPYLAVRPEYDATVSQRGLEYFQIRGSVIGLPVIEKGRGKVTGVLIAWTDRIGIATGEVELLQRFCDRLTLATRILKVRSR
jgi:hypothetical protein